MLQLVNQENKKILKSYGVFKQIVWRNRRENASFDHTSLLNIKRTVSNAVYTFLCWWNNKKQKGVPHCLGVHCSTSIVHLAHICMLYLSSGLQRCPLLVGCSTSIVYTPQIWVMSSGLRRCPLLAGCSTSIVHPSLICNVFRFTKVSPTGWVFNKHFPYTQFFQRYIIQRSDIMKHKNT